MWRFNILRDVKGKVILLIIFMVPLLFFTACSDDNKVSKKTEQNSGNIDEVTIKIALPLNEEFFHSRFDEVQKKLDDITLEYVPYGNTPQSLEELFASKVYPDIIIGDYPPIKYIDVGYPLDELIEKHEFDLDRIDPSLTSFMRSLDEEGRMVGLPHGGGSFWGLYYNKKVFDRLGKDYPDPEVPMTWDELMELTKEMTVEIDGEQYYGLANSPRVALEEFAAIKTDAKTGDVLVEKNPVFKRYLDLIDSYYDIPGMADPDKPSDPFSQEQTAAMALVTNDLLQRGWGFPDPEEIEHIDLAPVPVWKDQPNIKPGKTVWPMVIAEYSEHKDDAFKVLETYLEPDIQVGMAETMALLTSLADEDILMQYGSKVEQYEGKNIKAYFVGESALFESTQSNWDQYVDIYEAEMKLRDGNTDVVTVLRELAEESRAKIEDAMANE